MPDFERTNFSERVFDPLALDAVRSLPPSVRLHFHFAAHSVAEDFKALPEFFKACDVYIPEVDVWHDEAIREHQLVALGDKRTYEGLRRKTLEANPWPEAKLFELKLIYGGHKKLTLIGPHYEHPVTQKLEELISSPNLSMHWLSFSQAMHIREEEMLRSLGSNLNALISKTPKLATKPQIKVLLNMGNAHTAVYKAVAEVLNQPYDRRATRSFDSLPVRYNIFSALGRSVMFGQEVTQETALELEERINRFPDVE